jgi:hypothetical protein
VESTILAGGKSKKKNWIFRVSSSRTGRSKICSCVHAVYTVHHGLAWSCNMYVLILVCVGTVSHALKPTDPLVVVLMKSRERLLWNQQNPRRRPLIALRRSDGNGAGTQLQLLRNHARNPTQPANCGKARCCRSRGGDDVHVARWRVPYADAYIRYTYRDRAATSNLAALGYI